jgi:hypothetical protein
MCGPREVPSIGIGTHHAPLVGGTLYARTDLPVSACVTVGIGGEEAADPFRRRAFWSKVMMVLLDE